MTYKLPFELKQKPLAHYFEHGVIKFVIREGNMFYLVKRITKQNSGTISHGRVESKEMLDKLLHVKSFSEIQTIEVVQ